MPGSLHSCSEIVVSDAILDTSAMPRSVELENGDSAVVASANVTLHDFLDELVTIDRATGSAVERRSTRGDPDWPAVICPLGLIGVLTRVRFGVVDERHFEVVQKIVEMDAVLDYLDKTSATYDFWRVNWAPKSSKALLWAATELPPEGSESDGDYPSDRAEHILDFVFRVCDKLGDTGPLFTKPLELVYEVMTLGCRESRATGPLRNMLPVDRRAPLHVALAEWSFRPRDLQRVLGGCEDYFGTNGWPNIPTEIELSRADGSLMSAWNWDGLDYVVKLSFMYLTEVCTEPGEKEQIYAHLHGLREHLERARIPFKAPWGKINFIDPEFVARNHDLDAFRPLVQPTFANAYLTERIGPV